VPVVRHDAVSKNGHRKFFECFAKNIQNLKIVVRGLKKGDLSGGSVAKMENDSGGAGSAFSRHIG
jgi:hypothetical protein